MKEIKFRAWTKGPQSWSKHNMIYDFWWHNTRECGVTVPENAFVGKEYELMQYTGLTDKNGVDIYEGDIADIDDENMYVAWDDSRACFGWKFCEPVTFAEDYVDTSILWPSVEVIGNIHENPELLE